MNFNQGLQIWEIDTKPNSRFGAHMLPIHRKVEVIKANGERSRLASYE